MADTEKKVKRVLISLKLKLAFVMVLLTSLIIISISYYFINDESKILEDNIFQLAERELNNLVRISASAIAQNDPLGINPAIESINKLDILKYAYIIDSKGQLLLEIDKYKEIQDIRLGEVAGLTADLKKLDDDITKKVLTNKKRNNILQKNFPDPNVENGLIYDFSMPVFQPNSDNILAHIRIGFTDELIRKQVGQVQKVTMYIALGFIVFSLIFAYILAFIATRPLKKLSNGVQVVSKGDLDYKIDVRSRDEIGLLASQFNDMTGELKNAKNREIENRIMEEQLEVAKEIQEGLNPMGYYNKRGIQIKGFTRAAKGVGGDYFDYIDIDDDRVGALISDVSGKGIPASLVMVMIRTVFVTAISQKTRIHGAEIVSAINNSLSADFAIDKFATLFFMIYNRRTQKLAFSNAGHGPLFCYRANKHKTTVTKIEGMPIGIMEESEYLQAEVPFNKGDIVVLYTDGITEMRNSEKEEYGRLRLQKLIMKYHNENAETLADIIVKDVDDFRGDVPPHDDMTTLVLKRDE